MSGQGWWGAQGHQLGAEPPPLPPLQNFINRNLEAKEERINKLHSEGDQLLAAEHPGRNSIEVCVPWVGAAPKMGVLHPCLSLHFAVFPSSV